MSMARARGNRHHGKRSSTAVLVLLILLMLSVVLLMLLGLGILSLPVGSEEDTSSVGDLIKLKRLKLSNKKSEGDGLGERGEQWTEILSWEQCMDRYQKVEKPKADAPIAENEIRITSQGRMRSYITYAMTLLQENGSDEIVFKAMGRAINKTVTIVELIKRRIVGLHQVTAIQSNDITDTWEPLEEGLQILETTRKVSVITITLSKKELDKANIGYQLPIPAGQVKVPTELDYEGEGSPPARRRGGRGGRGRGRPRPPSENGFASGEFDDGGYERDLGPARGRGRGGARNFRGSGRGGGYYGGPRFDAQHEDTEGYNYQEAPRGRGRWRGRGRGRAARGLGHGFVSDGPPVNASAEDAQV